MMIVGKWKERKEGQKRLMQFAHNDPEIIASAFPSSPKNDFENRRLRETFRKYTLKTNRHMLYMLPVERPRR